MMRVSSGGQDRTNRANLANSTAPSKPQTPRSTVDSKLADLKKATQGVEALFVKDLLAAMRRGVPKGGLGESMAGGEVYRDMLDQALADSIGRSNSLGIGKILYEQLSQQIIRGADVPSPDVTRERLPNPLLPPRAIYRGEGAEPRGQEVPAVSQDARPDRPKDK